jgi:hypothetical protein
MAVNYGWKIKVKTTSCRQSNVRKSKLESVPNEEIRRIMGTEETVLETIEARKLRWF